MHCPALAVGQCQEHTEMTAESPEVPVTEGARSLEVRWIFPGRLKAAAAGWFGRFPARMESREDTYLLEPRLGGLSVKPRGGSPFSLGSGNPAGWRPVRKRRRLSRFYRAAGRSLRVPRGQSGGRGVRWNLPRSTRAARTGGPWDLRRPGPAICSAANWSQACKRSAV